MIELLLTASTFHPARCCSPHLCPLRILSLSVFCCMRSCKKLEPRMPKMATCLYSGIFMGAAAARTPRGDSDSERQHSVCDNHVAFCTPELIGLSRRIVPTREIFFLPQTHFGRSHSPNSDEESTWLLNLMPWNPAFLFSGCGAVF